MAKDIRTDNDFFFGTNGQTVAAMFPVSIETRDQAFRTAAWIKLMGETLPNEGGEEVSFEEVEEAIWNT